MTTTKKLLIALAVALVAVGLWFLWKRRGAASTIASLDAHTGADRGLGSDFYDKSSGVTKAPTTTPEGAPGSSGPIPVGTPGTSLVDRAKVVFRL